jgi:hypothetical protein
VRLDEWKEAAINRHRLPAWREECDGENHLFG